jgi:hypothetical protein
MIFLTKDDVCEILKGSIEQWKDSPVTFWPRFPIETWYAEYFVSCLSRLPVDPITNIVPIVTLKINHELDLARQDIGKIIKQHQLAGTSIFKIIYEEKFIVRKDLRVYSKQLTGRPLKDLKQVWERYNLWLLTNLYWQGIVWSQEPGFEIILPDDIEGPMTFFLTPETKPLWGMRIKAREAGTLSFGTGGHEIKPTCPEVYFRKAFS